MIFPVRCFTCGKVLGNLWNEYTELSNSHNQEYALNKMKITRICCRRMFLGHVELIDKIIHYNNDFTSQSVSN